MRTIINNMSNLLLGGLILSGCATMKKAPEQNAPTTRVDTTTEVSAGSSATSSVLSNNVKTVTPDQFNQLLLLDDVQVVDVRTAEEYQSGHIEDAVNIDVQKNDFKTKVSKLDKSKPVLVYCRSGKRSEKAATTLESMGFKRIVNLEGGMLAWEEEDKPVKK